MTVRPGVCEGAGQCRYSTVDLECPGGCVDGVCQAAPCTGVQCTTPPAATSGTIYVVGSTEGSLPGQTLQGTQDAFVCAYDSNGTQLWLRQFGTTGYELARAIGLVGSSVRVVGLTEAQLPGAQSLGGYDGFVSAFDSAGNSLRHQQVGTGAADYAYSLAITPSGLWVAGVTSGTLPGQTRSGVKDSFVMRLVP